MSVYVYQTFELKQDKFADALKNLKAIKSHRNEKYEHRVEILTPISGADHTYSLLSIYEGLAEMELQNKKMFDDDDYKTLISEFFLENIVQGSMYTRLHRTITNENNFADGDQKEKE